MSVSTMTLFGKNARQREESEIGPAIVGLWVLTYTKLNAGENLICRALRRFRLAYKPPTSNPSRRA